MSIAYGVAHLHSTLDNNKQMNEIDKNEIDENTYLSTYIFSNDGKLVAYERLTSR